MHAMTIFRGTELVCPQIDGRILISQGSPLTASDHVTCAACCWGQTASMGPVAALFVRFLTVEPDVSRFPRMTRPFACYREDTRGDTAPMRTAWSPLQVQSSVSAAASQQSAAAYAPVNPTLGALPTRIPGGADPPIYGVIVPPARLAEMSACQLFSSRYTARRCRQRAKRRNARTGA